jgi:hypothetical protein
MKLLFIERVMWTVIHQILKLEFLLACENVIYIVSFNRIFKLILILQ